MTAIGFIYYFKGHLSTTSFEAQKSFIFLLILFSTMSVTDHLGLSALHWFTYLVISVPIVFIITLLDNRKDNVVTWGFFFSNRYLAFAAVMYVVAEFFYTRVRVSLISVTVSNIAILMALPIIMITMTFIWKESTLKKQFTFGLLMMLTGMLSFF